MKGMYDDALMINDSLLAKSRADAKKFSSLMQDNNVNEPNSRSISIVKKQSWAEKVAKMREIHPNAYKPWSIIDDDMLKQYFYNGETIAEMANKLGRHEGSILLFSSSLFQYDSSHTYLWYRKELHFRHRFCLFYESRCPLPLLFYL